MAELPSTEKVINTYRQVTIYYPRSKSWVWEVSNGQDKEPLRF